MAENYTDEDYHRLHRAHCHTAERLAAAEAARDEAVQLATQGRLAHGVAARQRDEAQAENARLRDSLGIVVAQLRHAYAHLHAERVTDQRSFATGLIGPQVERLEKLSA